MDLADVHLLLLNNKFYEKESCNKIPFQISLNMKNKILLLFLLMKITTGYSQLNSFIITQDSDSIFINEILVNEIGDIGLFGNGLEGRFFFFELKEDSNFLDGYKFWTNPPMNLFPPRNTSFDGDKIFASHGNTLPSDTHVVGFNIFGFDLETEAAWMRFGGGYSRFKLDFILDDPTNNIYTILNDNCLNQGCNFSDEFYSFYFSPNGKTIWQKGYKLADPSLTEYIVTALEVEKDPENFFYSLGEFGSIDNFFDTIPDHYFILKTDNLGTPQNWKRIVNHQVDHIYIDQAGDIYLLGKTYEDFTFSENKENAVLVKLDKELNEIWTKVYHAENFEFSKVTLNVGKDGNLYLAYSTFGAFPVILAKLDLNGEIIWEKGYPFFEPEIDVLPNGSLMMLTRQHFDENQNIIWKTIIAKTDSLGNFENCETFPTCLEVEEIETEFASFQLDTFSIPDIDSIEVFVEPVQFSFSDFCDIPPPPSPEFVFPDTVCIYDCVTTSDTYNFYAHGIEWRLENENVNVLLKDSLSFEYCFEEEGEFSLEQTIWFLGCSYTFEKNIVVKDLEIAIMPDSVRCNDFPVELEVVSNFPLVNYEWNTGEATRTINVLEESEVFVIVDDGYCMETDTIFFRNITNENCPLDLKIPNVFTPDGDFVNDEFRPLGDYFRLEKMRIYNRWGQKVFEKTGEGIFWNGECNKKPCVSDVYIYQIEYINLLNNVLESVSGDVTLIR